MLVILRSKTGKADPAAKAVALGGRLVGYRSSTSAAQTQTVAVEAVDVASALADAGSAWVCVASGDAADLAAMIEDL